MALLSAISQEGIGGRARLRAVWPVSSAAVSMRLGSRVNAVRTVSTAASATRIAWPVILVPETLGRPAPFPVGGTSRRTDRSSVASRREPSKILLTVVGHDLRRPAFASAQVRDGPLTPGLGRDDQIDNGLANDLLSGPAVLSLCEAIPGDYDPVEIGSHAGLLDRIQKANLQAQVIAGDVSLKPWRWRNVGADSGPSGKRLSHGSIAGLVIESPTRRSRLG